LLAVKDRHIMQ